MKTESSLSSSHKSALRAIFPSLVAIFIASTMSSCMVVQTPNGPRIAPAPINAGWRMAPTWSGRQMFCGNAPYTTMVHQYRRPVPMPMIPMGYGTPCGYGGYRGPSYGGGAFNSTPFYYQNRSSCRPTIGAPWQAPWNPPTMNGPVICTPRMPVYVPSNLRGYGGRMW